MQLLVASSCKCKFDSRRMWPRNKTNVHPKTLQVFNWMVFGSDISRSLNLYSSFLMFPECPNTFSFRLVPFKKPSKFPGNSPDLLRNWDHTMCKICYGVQSQRPFCKTGAKLLLAVPGTVSGVNLSPT